MDDGLEKFGITHARIPASTPSHIPQVEVERPLAEVDIYRTIGIDTHGGEQSAIHDVRVDDVEFVPEEREEYLPRDVIVSGRPGRTSDAYYDDIVETTPTNDDPSARRGWSRRLPSDIRRTLHPTRACCPYAVGFGR